MSDLTKVAGDVINTGYIGGYKHGLYDGRNTKVKQLEARIAQLEERVHER